MPTNRTFIRRASRRKIDAEALRLWRTIREIDANPWDRDEHEPLGRRGEFGELNLALCRRLGLLWTTMSWPITCAEPDPPPYMEHNPFQAAAWRAAYGWRCALIEAAAEAP